MHRFEGFAVTFALFLVFGFVVTAKTSVAQQTSIDVDRITLNRSGNLYLVDSLHARVLQVTRNGDIHAIAGLMLQYPIGIAVDKTGSVYIDDAQANTIQKWTRDGMMPVVTGKLNFPGAIAVDGVGNLYISDTGNHRIQEIEINGRIRTIAGTGTLGFSGDGGPAISAELNFPNGIAVDTAGNLYIADRLNRRIRKVTTDGVIHTIAADLEFPLSVCVDRKGNVFFAEPTSSRIRKLTPAGVISTVVGSGTQGFNGDAGSALTIQLNAPTDVVVDYSGNLYVADGENHRVRKITPNGNVSTVAGNGGSAPKQH